MELSGNELNGKLFEEEDYRAKEERKQKPADETNDRFRVFAGLRRLPTIEKRLICDPNHHSPCGQGHISVQNLQPIDVAAATDGHKADSMSKYGWENASFTFESTI